MCVLSKVHNIQLVKIQLEERLAASSGLTFASSRVTGCGEAKRMGYEVATQVKGLSPEITIVSAADVVHSTEGCTLFTASSNLQSWNIAGSSGSWRGDESPTGSETVAPAKHFNRTFLEFDMGTREGQSVLLTGVCSIKPINGKIVRTIPWESEQLIVPLKRGNAREGKGLAVESLGQGHIHRTKRWVKDGNKTGLITYSVNDRATLLKSRMRENLKSCSVRELIAVSGRRWL